VVGVGGSAKHRIWSAWRWVRSPRLCKAVPVELVLGVFALTVAALTLGLAARRILNLVSRLVFSRFIAVRGMVAFSVTRTDMVAEPATILDDRPVDTPKYHVRFEVGGPGAFDNVSVHLLGLPDPHEGGTSLVPPGLRYAMRAGDDPIDWTFTLPDPETASHAWVLVTWVRSHFDGTDSEAIAQRLDRNRLYEWRWYTEPTRFLRTGIRNLARRYPRRSTQKMRDMSLYGRWRRTASSSRFDMLGPADRPPPP
jgi:hypothetical protein